MICCERRGSVPDAFKVCPGAMSRGRSMSVDKSESAGQSATGRDFQGKYISVIDSIFLRLGRGPLRPSAKAAALLPAVCWCVGLKGATGVERKDIEADREAIRDDGFA
jgi:hypothetical protein